VNKKKLKIVLFSAFIVFIASFLVMNFPTSLGGNTRYEPVLTGSMEPAISVGSLVLIKPVDTASLKVGDIICYRFSDERLVTHRIIEVNSEGYITKGDANEEKDIKTVQSHEVVGSIVLTIPLVGFIGSLINTPIGLLLLFFIPGIAFILLEIKDIMAELSKSKKLKNVT